MTTPEDEMALAPNAGLDTIVPAEIWKDCRVQAVPQPNAIETAVCVPPGGMPDRWEISSYRSGSDLLSAYRAEFSRHAEIDANSGRCNSFSWGGEGQWLHGKNKPGGRTLLLLRRRRRRRRLDARTARPADPSRRAHHGARGRERPRRPDALVAALASPDRQGASGRPSRARRAPPPSSLPSPPPAG